MEYVKLDDIADITMGQSPKSDSYNKEQKGLPFFQGNADFGKINPKVRVWCSKPKKIAQPGDVLISVRAPIGAVNITKVKSAIGRGLAAISIEDGKDREYIYRLLKSKKDELNKLGTGSTFKAINKQIIKGIKVPVISKDLKNLRVNQLNQVEKSIELKRSELLKLDELIKARFVEMFGDPQDSKSKWKKSTIEKCCTLKSGKTLPRNIENEGGNIPYVKVKDMNSLENMTYITTSTRFVSDKTANKSIFPVGTVIFPKRGGAIGTNKKRLTKVPICADLNIMGVIPDNTRISSYYLFEYFNMVDLNTLNNGSSVPQINNKDINPLNINIPPLSLQNEFASFVQQVDKSKFESIVYLNKTLSSKILSQLGDAIRD